MGWRDADLVPLCPFSTNPHPPPASNGPPFHCALALHQLKRDAVLPSCASERSLLDPWVAPTQPLGAVLVHPKLLLDEPRLTP